MRRGFTWLVPDLALVTATVALFYCLFLFQGYQKLFRDSDAGWHIRTGEWILETRTLPRSDPYSFSRAGQPWFAWEWGADVLVGAIHRTAGLRGVALFYGTVIAAGVWLWFRLQWALRGDFLVSCAMTPLLLTTSNIHWLARPHVIGWLFLLAAVLWAETAHAPGWRQAVWLALFMALWANLHASFFMGAVVAAIYAVGRRARWGWCAVVICLAAPLANPYGWNLYTHIFRYLTDSALLSQIGEFQSFDFHAAGSGQIIAALILGIGGGALALGLRRYEHFLLAMLISVIALRSARGLPLAALVLLPLANAAIVKTVALPWAAYAGRLRELDAGLRGWAWIAPVLVVAYIGLRAVPTGFPPDQFPVAAYSHLPSQGRLFAPDKFGGYLIYRSAGARKVFFDGRSDFYGAEFLKEYSQMVQARPGWREVWDHWQFTYALMPPDYALLAALEQAGWREVYRDRTAVLLQGGGT